MDDQKSVSGEEKEREFDYSTDAVELELDKLVNDIRSELLLEYEQHINLRRRCKCRQYLTNLNAHPNQAACRGIYCRLQPLDGQVLWSDGRHRTSIVIHSFFKVLNKIECYG